MKNVLLNILYFFCVTISAQEYQSLDKGKVYEISIKEHFTYNDFEIKMASVGVDSRCPQEVTCIRTGEVDVDVEVYYLGKRILEQQLTFTPSGYMPNSGNLYNSEDLKITAFDLEPYPKATEVILKQDYKLKISIVDHKE
ncbi:hypothetical protein [Winogradskyella immobilis]|uniref:Uncharacterized protein n=1 Tax=Winogradskyella immobilis TaxID=2816852 RepID=A0ABS8EPS4_9FLAO|nr:hypothetical protein [Winogradskyella immobilis]MCC1485221.1 hypothetical protein [Winogradskyella immobilis]MCG0017313.1 hypothetical protein [Winogradskyella immobilis]